MEADKVLLELWRRYKWTVLLALAGLIFAVCVITYGLFKAIFIFICIGLGIAGGMRLDKRANRGRRPEDPYYHE